MQQKRQHYQQRLQECLKPAVESILPSLPQPGRTPAPTLPHPHPAPAWPSPARDGGGVAERAEQTGFSLAGRRPPRLAKARPLRSSRLSMPALENVCHAVCVAVTLAGATHVTRGRVMQSFPLSLQSSPLRICRRMITLGCVRNPWKSSPDSDHYIRPRTLRELDQSVRTSQP